jgi:hypothetical protein
LEAWVRLGQATVHVVVDNPDGVCSGVATMSLDGVKVADGRIDVDQTAQRAYEVHVRLGPTRATRLLDPTVMDADAGATTVTGADAGAGTGRVGARTAP